MSEFDPTATSRALDTILNRVHELPTFGVGDPRSQVDGLQKGGLLTDEDAQTLRTILTSLHSQPPPAGSAVVEEIDALLNGHTPIRPVMVSILKTIRFMASLQATADKDGQQPETLLSIPRIDLGEAGDGAVEGGGFGALAGGEIGALSGPGGAALGVAIGALLGGLVGGLVKGFAHGAQSGGSGSGSSGSGGGGKQLTAAHPAL
jgi:hypothetical protein